MAIVEIYFCFVNTFIFVIIIIILFLFLNLVPEM